MLLHKILCLLFVIIISTSPSRQSNEVELLKHLLKGHDRHSRPVFNISKPLNVTFGFELINLHSVMENRQTVKVKVWLRISWNSEVMRWAPEEWGGVKTVRLNYASVWTPDLYLVEEVNDETKGPETYGTHIICQHDGSQDWWIPALLHGSCTLEVKSFPYDQQQCTFTFLSWTHDKSEMDLHLDPRPVVTSNYVKSAEWAIISITQQRIEQSYSCCPNPFVSASYTVVFDRKSLYYIYNALVPCLIQMIIVSFTFLIPPESGERIGVVITVLLVFAVYLEVISNALPKTSSSIPALSLFYMAAMVTSSCSLLGTCAVLVVHFTGNRKGIRPVPKWITTMLAGMIRDVAPNPPEENPEYEAKVEGIEEMELKEKNDVRPMNGSIHATEVTKLVNCDSSVIQQWETIQCGDLVHILRAGENKLVEEPLPKMNTKHSFGQATTDHLDSEIKRITKRLRRLNHEEVIREQWQKLAKMLDRAFFVMFLVLFNLLSLSIMLPVYIAREQHQPHIAEDSHD